MVYLMLNFSRSGGTIINKCIAAQDSIVMASEVNPLYSAYDNFKEQMREWYNIGLKGDTLKEQLLEVQKKTTNKVFVRDWTFINFYPGPKNNFSPTCQLEILKKLKDVDHCAFAVVRNSLDVYSSNYKFQKSTHKNLSS